MSAANIADLKSVPTTLAEDGQLAAGAGLWAMEQRLAAQGVVPKAQQLHRELLESRVLARRVARRFKTVDWAVEVARRARSGQVVNDERVALYQLLLGVPELPANAWSQLRASPVLPNHLGRWSKPIDLLLPTASIPRDLFAALPVAHYDYARNKDLAKHLRLRTKIRGSDLVAAAHEVAKTPELARSFGQLLKRNARLLTRGIIRQLSGIAFLPSSAGALAAPSDVYLDNAVNRIALGDTVSYVRGEESSLYARLGCHVLPRSDAIVSRLETLREEGASLSNGVWERVYRELVRALEREAIRAGTLRDQAILNVSGTWIAPTDVLVGARHHQIFLDLVPILQSTRGLLARELGAPQDPQPQHWRTLFAGISARHPKGGPLSPRERSALRYATATLPEPPEGLDRSVRFLLDRRGYLHA